METPLRLTARLSFIAQEFFSSRNDVTRFYGTEFLMFRPMHNDGQKLKKLELRPIFNICDPEVEEGALRVASRDDACAFNHEDDGSLGSTRTMHYPFRYYESVSRPEFH